ncbi:MAG: guanylate kinase [Nitrospirota bacterium]
MKPRRGSLFVISAPSGAGKTTLCQRLCERLSGIKHSVSFTTRKPRPGELNDVHYTFVDKDTFRAMAAQGDFVEWAEVHGNFYGTSRKRIEEMLSAGLDVLLDIDVQGARQIRQNAADCRFIFILPPSMEVLRMRLAGRMSDTEEVIERRLRNAVKEIGEYKNYDYVIINDIFEEALTDLVAIVRSERCAISKVDHAWIEQQFLKEG